MLTRKNLAVLMSESAGRSIREMASLSHPHETGGILLGMRAGNRPWVTMAVEIESNDRGATHYRLPGGATSRAVSAARLMDRRLGYLGDWHSHPMDIPASNTDRATMVHVAQLIRSFKGPLLVVARRVGLDLYEIDAAQATARGIRLCTLTPTGDPPSESDSPTDSGRG